MLQSALIEPLRTARTCLAYKTELTPTTSGYMLKRATYYNITSNMPTEYPNNSINTPQRHHGTVLDKERAMQRQDGSSKLTA